MVEEDCSERGRGVSVATTGSQTQGALVGGAHTIELTSAGKRSFHCRQLETLNRLSQILPPFSYVGPVGQVKGYSSCGRRRN